ncbi:MAG: PAS domain S-box protein, partial [Thermodesulfobacteriota bacterium]
HPPMRSFLAVPISHQGQIYGRVYLCDKTTGEPFTGNDEHLAVSFARSLALALSHARELAERKRAEETVQASELWLRGIFNSLDEAVLVVTPDRKLVNVNEAAERMFGFSAAELVGQSTAILHVDQEHYVEFGRQIQAAFEKGKPARFEFKAKRKNGEVFPSDHTVSLLRDDHDYGGHPSGGKGRTAGRGQHGHRLRRAEGQGIPFANIL